MPHVIKEGDAKKLRWRLGRDLSSVASVRVIISKTIGATPAVDRTGTIEAPATDGIVSLTLTAGDYGVGKLVPGDFAVEVETLPGPLTHPDNGYETIKVLPDLGGTA